ncbi:hypothetical protein DFP72DRAFT_1077314 [Ephemerocybe angulata]|uniref:Uncharacterized protein n=1 Tax=Ephemerocybe angulata TaxID=980116 RepID=A0A8H6HEP6_9AGAR|nr:hypothetical protein DFP72DRAFT_1077314 [Tulosesus angulatus]
MSLHDIGTTPSQTKKTLQYVISQLSKTKPTMQTPRVSMTNYGLTTTKCGGTERPQATNARANRTASKPSATKSTGPTAFTTTHDDIRVLATVSMASGLNDDDGDAPPPANIKDRPSGSEKRHARELERGVRVSTTL